MKSRFRKELISSTPPLLLLAMRFPLFRKKKSSARAPSPDYDRSIVRADQDRPASTSQREAHSIRSATTSGATSPNAKAALNVFRSTLEVLGRAPIPGIGPVTAVLLRVISGLQEMPQVGPGWQQLVERMERLTFLICELVEFPKTADRAEELCRPLRGALNKLADDIDVASKQGRLPAFFNSTDDLSSIAEHERKLDSIVVDLTLAICARTPLTEDKLEEAFRTAVSRVSEEISRGGSPSGVTLSMSDNEFDGIEGDVDAHNTIFGGQAKMIREIHRNKFGKVKGQIFSHNMVIGK